jgi:hypothetical protein
MSTNSKGLSLHLGLNQVDPAQYEGWDGKLAGCENDARDMEAIAKEAGFTTKTLLTDKATATAATESPMRPRSRRRHPRVCARRG